MYRNYKVYYYGTTVLLAFVESEGERNVDSVKTSVQYCG